MTLTVSVGTIVCYRSFFNGNNSGRGIDRIYILSAERVPVFRQQIDYFGDCYSCFLFY